MATSLPALKRHNHRVHPCEDGRKNELLSFLLERESGGTVLVVAGAFPEKISESLASETVTFVTDDAIASLEGKTFDLVLSYDLPESVETYLERLKLAGKQAAILLETQRRDRLYPIETFLGRTVREEIIEGFAPIESGKRESRKATGKRKADGRPGSGKRKPGSGKGKAESGRRPAVKKAVKRIKLPKVKGTRTETGSD